MKNTRCVIYTRVASAMNDNPREAIVNQIAICKDFTKKHNLEVVNIFEDIAVSGNRGILDKLDEIIEYCKSNNISNLIVKDFTRLCRNMVSCNLILEKMAENDINLQVVDMDNSNSMSLAILTLQAQQRVEKRSKRRPMHVNV